MREFKSPSDYQRFVGSIRRSWRYVFELSVEEFLATVIETARPRNRPLEAGTILWRAQLGHGLADLNTCPGPPGKVPGAYAKERMKPTPQTAGDGRVNPKGIPCLYLADDKDTAMAEMRPWIGSYLSAARFRIERELVLMDCSDDERPRILVPSDCLSASERETVVWGEIAYAFSEPAERSGSAAEYAPSQVLAEAFRKDGYDGIQYKSSVGPGCNIALFDLDAAQMIGNGTLYRTANVLFEFEEQLTPYQGEEPDTAAN